MNVDTNAVSILQRIALYLFLISLSHSPMLVYRPSFSCLSLHLSLMSVCQAFWSVYLSVSFLVTPLSFSVSPPRLLGFSTFLPFLILSVFQLRQAVCLSFSLPRPPPPVADGAWAGVCEREWQGRRPRLSLKYNPCRPPPSDDHATQQMSTLFIRLFNTFKAWVRLRHTEPGWPWFGPSFYSLFCIFLRPVKKCFLFALLSPIKMRLFHAIKDYSRRHIALTDDMSHFRK